MKVWTKKLKKIFCICFLIFLSFLFCDVNTIFVNADLNGLFLSTHQEDHQIEGDSIDKTSSLASSYSSGGPMYNSSIYDGGIYYFNNVKSGKYLDVDHGYTDNGTNVLGWSYNGANNQKFYFNYLGMGLYEIAPYNSPEVILHVTSSLEDANVEIRTKKSIIQSKV